jgi:hypothetical protein
MPAPAALRQSDQQARARLTRALERARHLTQALAHPRQAAAFRRQAAAPVVSHLEHRAPVLRPQADPAVLGPRVADDVGDRLAQREGEHAFLVGVELDAVHVQDGPHAGGDQHALGVSQRIGQAFGSEAAHGLPDLAECFA